MNTASSTRPLSAHELRDAVRHGQAFDPARLDRVLRVDPEHGLAEVQAATRWSAIAAQLRPGDEHASRVGAGLPSVGTSIAWNAAGPDGRPAVRHVESLTLVTPDGELRRTSRAANAELFAHVIGGQGVFGALYSVTLRLDSLARALAETAPVQALIATEYAGPTRRLQLLVPAASLQAFLAQAQASCAEWRIDIARLEHRPTQAEDETVLAWARREYVQVSLTLAIPRTLGASVRVAQLCGELIDACIAHGGSFSVAHTTDASREQVEACYPELRRFLAEKRRVDPAERLVTPWYRHHRALLSRQACATRWNA